MRHRLDRPLTWLTGSLLAALLVPAGYGVLAVFDDLSSSTDEADGFGLLVGAVILVVLLGPLVATATATVLLMRRRPSGPVWAFVAGAVSSAATVLLSAPAGPWVALTLLPATQAVVAGRRVATPARR